MSVKEPVNVSVLIHYYCLETKKSLLCVIMFSVTFFMLLLLLLGWVLRRSSTSQVISVAFYIECEKSDKFCSEALISGWGSFTCRKFTIRDQRLYFSSEGSHPQDFYALKIHRIRPSLNPRTSDPVASMITTGPPVSTLSECLLLIWEL